MNPYQDMYTHLFNLVTDTITALQKVQQECEAIFMENEGPSFTVAQFPTPDDDL